MNSRIPTIPSGLIIHYNDSQNSGKCCTYNYWLETAKQRDTGWDGEGGKGKCRASVHSPCGIQLSSSQHITVFTNQEVPLSFSVPSFIGVSLHRHDRLKHCPMTELYLQSLCPPWRSDWPQIPTSNCMVGLSGRSPSWSYLGTYHEPPHQHKKTYSKHSGN